jgi:hypothetical protein
VHWLDACVEDGSIGAWGLSCPGLARPIDRSTRAEDAEALLDVVRRTAEFRHCRVLQLPFNLLELAVWRSGAAGPSALAIATQAGLGVIAERPLRAMASSAGVTKLVESRAEAPALAHALAQVRKLEAQWSAQLGRELRAATGDATELFRWGQLLSQREARPTQLEQWQRLRHEVIAPHVGQASAALLGHLAGEQRGAFARWWQQYGTALHTAFLAIEQDLATVPAPRRIAAALDPALPESWRSLSLAARAVGVVAASGVASVMVGVRTPAAVADLLALREALTVPIALEAVAAAIDPLAAQLAQSS